jgi:hypothetical protein
MSPNEFRLQAKERRIKFKQAWVIVSRDCQVFEEDTLQPDQCDRVRVSIQKLRDPVQEFSVLLDSVSRLPLSAIPFRYDLLKALHHIGYVVDELAVLLISFRRICRSPSRDALLQRQEIQRKFAELESSNQDIQHNVDRVLFLTRAEEDGVRVTAF